MKSQLEGILVNENTKNSTSKVYNKLYKLGFAIGLSSPEVYSTLSLEKYLHIIPIYEYNFAYVTHAALTLPILYSVAILGTYVDITLFLSTFLRIHRYFKNRQEKLKYNQF